MRVAFLTHEPFSPPSGGGSAEAVYLVRELVKRAHEVHVFGPPSADPDAVEKDFGIRLHPFVGWRMGRYTSFRNFKYALYPFFLARLVERAAGTQAFDAVLSQHAITAVAAGWLKKRLRVPVVMNFLDHLTGFMETWPIWLMPPPALAVLKRYELSLPLRYDADGVLTVSDTLADLFVRSGYPRRKITPIYYGYDADLFTYDEDVAKARSDSRPVIVMHGSLDHHHLQRIALEAMARVHEARPQAVFRFVGHRTGALETFLRSARRRLPNLPVECTGFVPYREVARQVADATIGMVPYEESNGTHCAFVAKIVEYLGLGLPVVSTPLDSARRYFGDEPLVRFSGFNGASFAERILSWLDEPVARRLEMGQAASLRVRQELDWRVICRNAVGFVETSVKSGQ
jgi:glycosyltransferase involved in cell wall biosynthesis